MTQKIRQLLRNPILSGSLIMVIGSNLINGLNYLYHFVIGRLLGPSSYGELAALFSVLSLLTIIPGTLGLVIIKFIAISQDKREIGGLIQFFQKMVLAIGLVVLLISVLLAKPLGQFLQIDQPLLFIFVSVGFLISTLAFVNKSVLQGLVRFSEYVIAGLVENSLKLGLGVLLVWVGWSVSGAMIGLVLAYLAGLAISWWFIRQFRVERRLPIAKVKQVLKFTLPVLIQSITTISLYSSDIILVKHFFWPTEAGIYASVSALSRIILFASGPVSAVMFPWVAKKQAARQQYWGYLDLSLGLTAAVCAVILIWYRWWPAQAILGLYGPAYLAGGNLLFSYGLSMSLLTLAILLINFFLSIGRTRIVVLPLIASIAQIWGIWWWHQSLSQVIEVSVVVNGGLLIGLSGYLCQLRLRNRR